MANLHSDIIADILKRLKVVHLLRFRCVSKSWRNLIDSPDFTKLHLDHSIKSSTNQALILKHSKKRIYWVSLNSQNLLARVIDQPLMCYNHCVRLLGSCNGLVCISNIVDDTAFWNPSTRKHHVLPFSSLDRKQYGGSVYSTYAYGFGCDLMTDDYKLVRIAQFRGVESEFFECEIKVYSLARNYWRCIRDMPYVLRYPETNGVYASGTLHWVVSGNVKSEEYNIVIAIDLAIEDYKEVALPEFVDQNFGLEVGVLGDCLCVVANYSKTHSDVWLMKEYGVKDSWTKLFSLSQEQTVGSLRSLRPIGYCKGGDQVLLMQDRLHLLQYDLKKEIVTDVMIRDAPYLYEVEICLRSLVSFNVIRRNVDRNQIAGDKKNVKKRDDFLSVGFKLVL